MKLRDKVVIITGGANGIGKGLAGVFVREGAKVVVVDKDKSSLSSVAANLQVQAKAVDVRRPAGLDEAAQETVKQFGRIDIWINCAGIQIAPSDLESVSPHRLTELFEVNVFGYFYGCQAALRQMKLQNEGLIVNINSTAGLGGKSGLSAYCASKFAVKGLTESAREELKGTNISVYQVFPGGVQTDIYHEKVPDDFDMYMPIDYLVARVMDNLKQDIPVADLVVRRPSLA